MLVYHKEINIPTVGRPRSSPTAITIQAFSKCIFHGGAMWTKFANMTWISKCVLKKFLTDILQRDWPFHIKYVCYWAQWLYYALNSTNPTQWSLFYSNYFMTLFGFGGLWGPNNFDKTLRQKNRRVIMRTAQIHCMRKWSWLTSVTC